MNLNRARTLLAGKVAELAAGWQASTSTWPELGTMTAVVGHAAPTPAVYRGGTLPLPLTLWVNEANSQAAIDALYAALDWSDESSLVRKLDALEWVRVLTVDTVEPREAGPTLYTAADLTVTVAIWKLP